MNFQQSLAFAVIAATMAMFVWGRLRYDLVAALSLLAAVAVGLVPYKAAFAGFSDDIVIIVGSALLVSAAIGRTGLVEALLQKVAPNIQSVRAQMLTLLVAVTLLSAFVKNIGALAIMIPIAFQMARRSGVSPSIFLMPMAFGSLLGGLMTQIGTSPNIIVSRMREELGGKAFTMFDFTPVGACLAAVGVIFLFFGYRLLPARVRTDTSIHEALVIDNYLTEATVPGGSPMVGKTLADLHKLADGDAMVLQIIHGGERRAKPLPDAILSQGDVLLIEGDPAALDRIVSGGQLSLAEGRRPEKQEPDDEVGAIEAVIGEHSQLLGLTAQRLALFERFDINLLAVSRTGRRMTERLGDITLRFGDVIVLQGNVRRLPEVLLELGCLPLAARTIRLGSVRRGLIPALILAVAMLATAFGVVPVAIAFFAAAVAMVLSRSLPLREAYEAVDWPILVMIGALIPVSDALRTSGATDLIAGWLTTIGVLLPPYGALALIMVAAMAVTPFLNNAATVLVMAPIAAGYSQGLGYAPDAFLMAVAIGAGSDFLTPIGHQCNTLVMSPGGYRFADYWRLGLPLSALVLIVGVPLLMVVWPL